METALKELMKLAGQLNGVQLFFVSVVFLIVAFYLLMKQKDFRSFVMLFLKRTIDRITDEDLMSHELFYKVELYKHRVNEMRFGEPYLDVIFRIILLNKLTISVELTRRFVSSFEFKCMKSDVLLLRFMAEIKKIVLEYNDKIRKDLNAAYSKNGDAIFDYVMNSESGFNIYHANNINHILNLIEVIAHSKLFSSNNERVMLYLTEIQNALKTATLDAERQFSKYNGELKKLICNAQN
jgi:hypothetical protein